MQHDLDATALGFPARAGSVHRAPLPRRRPSAGQVGAGHAGARAARGGRGRILTGDQFITAADAARGSGYAACRARLSRWWAPRALVATVNRVPFVIIRLVSDPRRRRSARRLRHLAAPRRRQLLHRLHRHPARPDHPPAPPSWVSAAEREPATRSAPRPIPLCHRRSRDQQRRNYGSIGLPRCLSPCDY